MGHFVGPDVTSGPTPALHAGLNTKVATYTLNETASGSVTIAICAIPGGAVVTQCQAEFSALDTSGGGTIALQAWIAGASVAEYISSASGSTQIISTWNPDAGVIGYRLTSSANLVIKITNVSATGTASTSFTTVLQYTSDQDPD